MKPGGLYSFDYGFWLTRGKIGRISTAMEPAERVSVSAARRPPTGCSCRLSTMSAAGPLV